MRSLGLSLTLLVAVLHCMHAARTIPKHSIDIVSNTHTHKRRGGDDVPGTIKPTYAGYLKVSPDGSAIYYAYYEAQTQGKSEDAGDAPIVLWLQASAGGGAPAACSLLHPVRTLEHTLRSGAFLGGRPG